MALNRRHFIGGAVGVGALLVGVGALLRPLAPALDGVLNGLTDLLAIGELARRNGLSVSAIRYYEARGLVEPIRTGGKSAATGLGVLLAGPLVCATSQAVNDWFDRHVDAKRLEHICSEFEVVRQNQDAICVGSQT